jgi:tRNA modification GTPase
VTGTIFALATAPGRAAVALVRLSGDGAAEAVRAIAGSLPPAREARVRRLRDAAGEPIDQAMVLWLPGPESYTGEDSAELHLHGGPAVVDAVSDALMALGLRPAEPGEFTRRAFERGRIGLDQAEAVADLVEAETEGQRRQALAQLGGALGRRYEAWRESLLQALMVLEAAIDFPDEDLPQDVAARARPHLEHLLGELDEALADAARGERVREGLRVALIGAPNAGKSSLLNRLIGREAAIVTATPGTTRDVIEQPLVLAGYKLLLADMAGLRATSEEIEAEGVRRARAWAEDADLRLWVVDAASSEGRWREAAGLARIGDVLVLNKTDLQAGADREAAAAFAADQGLGVVETVASTAGGAAGVRARVEAVAVDAMSGREFPAATRARHRARLVEAQAHVARALEGLDSGAELAAEDLRLAGRALGRITGRIDPEDVLERIFASFCIGK